MKRFLLVIGALALAAGCSGGSSNGSSSGSTGAGTTGHATTSSTTGAGTTTGTNSGTTGGSTTGGSGSSGSIGSSGSSGSTGSVTCTEITADPSGWAYTSDLDGPYFATSISPNLGDSASDVLAVRLFDLNGGNFTQTGSFDLGSGDNANYASCPECVLVYEGAADGGEGRTFFQSRGTLDIAAADTGTGLLQATLTDTTLVEVTIDGSYQSSVVDGGACLHLASATIDVSPTTSSSSGSGSTSSTGGTSSGSTSSGSGSGSGSTSSGSGSSSGSTSSGSSSSSGSTSSGSGSGSGSTSSGSGSGSTSA